MKIARLAVVSATALALVAGSYGFASADEKHVEEMPAVVITGGTISNTTDINVSANAGSGMADASGGDHNIGTAGGGGMSVSTASAGNGGSANAGANGGAVSMGNISSGSNAGNSIIVGNTNAGGKDGGDGGKDGGGGDAGHAGGGEGMVVALPETGVAGFDAGLLSMIAAAGAAGAAGLGLRRR